MDEQVVKALDDVLDKIEEMREEGYSDLRELKYWIENYKKSLGE